MRRCGASADPLTAGLTRDLPPSAVRSADAFQMMSPRLISLQIIPEARFRRSVNGRGFQRGRGTA